MSDVAAGKLLTSNDIRELCAQLNIRPTKTLGQNFVNDPGTVRKIVRNAGVQAGEQAGNRSRLGLTNPGATGGWGAG